MPWFISHIGLPRLTSGQLIRSWLQLQPVAALYSGSASRYEYMNQAWDCMRACITSKTLLNFNKRGATTTTALPVTNIAMALPSGYKPC
jgi:hypothetical protein